MAITQNAIPSIPSESFKKVIICMMQDTRTKRRGRKLQQKGGRQLKGSFYFIAKEIIFNAESNR